MRVVQVLGATTAVAMLIAGCGGSTGSSSNSATVASGTPSAGQDRPAGKSTTSTEEPTAGREAPSESAPGIDLNAKKGSTQPGREVCDRLSVEKLIQLLHIPKKLSVTPVHVRPVPVPFSMYPNGIALAGCQYKGTAGEIWLDATFAKSKTNLQESIQKDPRPWLLTEINGYEAAYTGGKHGFGYTTELLVRVGPEELLDLVPYKTSGIPKPHFTPQEEAAGEGAMLGQPVDVAPPFVQRAAEEAAEAILR